MCFLNHYVCNLDVFYVFIINKYELKIIFKRENMASDQPYLQKWPEIEADSSF